MTFDYKDVIIDFLKGHEGQKFTPNALAKWFVENYPEEAREKGDASKNKKVLKATTPEEKHKAIVEIYAGEISSSKLGDKGKRNDINICVDEGMRLYYTPKADLQATNQPLIKHQKISKSIINKDGKITEEQAYLMLSYFLKNKLNIYNP